MREILFRGKRIANGKWIDGYIFTQHNSTEHRDDYYIRAYDTDYLIDPETRGEFTGLTDKNGVKIFEGDIVKSHHCTYVIMWDSVKALFYLKDPVTRVSSDFYNYFGSDLTVIGNIHDNPELLEGGDDNA